MPIYEVGEDQVALHDPKVGYEVESVLCPECEEGKLVVQVQEGRTSAQEYYLECSDDECGACFYPQS